MRNLAFVLAGAALLSACQPRHPSDEARGSALKSAEDARARKNAEEDAIQAERQLNLVAERNRSGVQQEGESTNKDTDAPPKK